MRYFIVLFLVCAICFGLVGQEFSFAVIDKIDIKNSVMVEQGSKFYFSIESDRDTAKMFISGFKRGTGETVTMAGSFHFFLSSLDSENIIIIHRDKDRTRSVFEYEVKTKEMRDRKDLHWILEMNYGRRFSWIPYQNGAAFVEYLKFFPEQGSLPSEYSLYNFEEELEYIAGTDRSIIGMTPDKMHLLMSNDKKLFLSIMNIQSGEITDVEAPWHWWSGESKGEGILSNSLYFSRPGGDFYDKFGNGEFLIHKIGDKQMQEKVSFTVKQKGIKGIFFHSSLNFAFVKADFEYYLVDTTPFRDWLLAHNLLFKPTTAAVSGSPELRENPNLEAQILGTLEAGTKLTVIDRSGIKVEIDGTEDWWYKVELSDNTTGWVHGLYLELESYQGPLTYRDLE